MAGPRSWGIRAVVVLTASVLGFVVGAGVAVSRGWGSPIVQIDVVNAAGQELRSVVLEYESCGGKHRLEGSSLAPRANSRFRFLACGEVGYQVQVTRADGSVLAGGGGYAEGGYRITETVEQSRIRAEISTHLF